MTEIEILQQSIISQVQNTTDPNLLDLVYKLLLTEAS